MADYVTKKELEKSLDKYQAVILDAVNVGFEEAKKERAELRQAITKLTTTLDVFLKRLTDFEDEFTILKAEVAKMKTFLKNKFGVDISLQGK